MAATEIPEYTESKDPHGLLQDATARDSHGTFETPRSHRLFGIRIPPYRSPMVQIGVVSFILFLNPGMYNALAGLGGAGQMSATVQNRASIGLHIVFAIVGFFVGVINNRIGTKWTMV